MRNLKEMTEDELMELHMDQLYEIGYHTSEIKHSETHVNDAVKILNAIDEELESRENPKLKPVSN